MEKIMEVRNMGIVARLANLLMVPIMHILAGKIFGKVQRTHPWNRQILNMEELDCLNQDWMVHCKGVKAIPRKGKYDWLFHAPILGGWKTYVVLEPLGHPVGWHIGWSFPGETAVSQIKLTGPVRMLLGPGDVSFFAINNRGEQVFLNQMGKCLLGAGGSDEKIPLL